MSLVPTRSPIRSTWQRCPCTISHVAETVSKGSPASTRTDLISPLPEPAGMIPAAETSQSRLDWEGMIESRGYAAALIRHRHS